MIKAIIISLICILFLSSFFITISGCGSSDIETVTPTNNPTTGGFINGKTLDENLEELSSKFVHFKTITVVNPTDSKFTTEGYYTSNTYGDYKFENVAPGKTLIEFFENENGKILGSKVITIIPGYNFVNLIRGHFEDPNGTI